MTLGRLRRRPRGLAGPLAVAVLLTVVGCSKGAVARSATAPAAGTSPALPATEPYLIMSGSAEGWAVWPSGGSWVLLHTTDGFAHVTNRTPVAVETDGGLGVSALPGRVAVAVGAHGRLLRSPVLTGTGESEWIPVELPGPVAATRSGVSVAGGRLTAVTTSGTVLARTAAGWATLATLAGLAPGWRGQLDGITWASASVGWVTAHGPAGEPMAFQTSDGGAAWVPVPQTSGATVAALAPCGEGQEWLLPVIDGAGKLALLRTGDGGHHWARGAELSAANGEPAWSCSGADALMVARASGADHVFASADRGQTWVDRGPAPARLTSLALTAPGKGFAASAGKYPTLWSVSSDGARFTEVPLPAWVSTVGAQAPGD